MVGGKTKNCITVLLIPNHGYPSFFKKYQHISRSLTDEQILICDTKIFKRGAYSLAQKGEKKSSLETVLVAKTSKDNGEFERMLQSPEISEFLKTGKILKFEDCLDSVPSLVKQTDTVCAFTSFSFLFLFFLFLFFFFSLIIYLFIYSLLSFSPLF